MALLSELGHHIQMNKIDEKGNEKMLFPVNTADDVYMNEDGNTLSEYIPTVVDSLDAPTTASPVTIVEKGTVQVEDSVAELLMG